MHNSSSQNVSDAVLTSGLVAAPAWVDWLTHINQLLTSLTLLVGLVLGLARLWALWRNRRDFKQH